MDSELLAVSECGLGKRTPVSDYPAKGRGGMGVITLDVTDKTGKLVALTRVAGDEELMVLTGKGTVIRTRVEEVRVTGRNALIGILIRNSIILVHEIQALLAQGRSQWQAVFEASDSRARPILLTAAAAEKAADLSPLLAR